jgi:ABC-2 type transport system ATP-binding protein
MAALLEVKDLHKQYDDGFKAVKGVSFSVKRGEVFGILGPNGAGKTTTLEMIEGLRTITSGTIRLDGLDVAKDTYAVKERIGIQLQSSAFFPNLKLIELLRLFNDLYAESSDPMELLREVGLEEKAHAAAKELSGGQRQRFSIATTLVNKPVAVFLDEPTTGLDPQARRNLWDLIKQIQEKGTTVILTTHYMEEAQVLCDRVAIMDEGKIIALDTPDHLITQLLGRGFQPHVSIIQPTLGCRFPRPHHCFYEDVLPQPHRHFLLAVFPDRVYCGLRPHFQEQLQLVQNRPHQRFPQPARYSV